MLYGALVLAVILLVTAPRMLRGNAGEPEPADEIAFPAQRDVSRAHAPLGDELRAERVGDGFEGDEERVPASHSR